MKNKILILAFLLMSSSCSIFKHSQTISEKDTKEANDEFASVNIKPSFLKILFKISASSGKDSLCES